MQLRHLANRVLPLPGVETPAQAPLAVQRPNPPAAATAASPGPEAPARAQQGPDAVLVLASIGELVYDWDLTTDRLNWGSNLKAVLGDIANADLSTGIAYGERLCPESAGSRYDAIVNADEDDEGAGVPYEATYALAPPRNGGGEPPIWVEDQGRWFKGPDGRPAHAHGVIRVVTQRHEEERDLAIRSRVDPLTGALNRAHVADHIQRYIKLSERTRKPFALLLVALENLFALNRTYGYDAGDDVIAGLAARLRANVRVNDLVARHAGNKFAIVLDNCDSDEMHAVAMRLIECVTQAPFDTAAGPVPATIRIGGVVAPREGRTINSLAQRAEEALDAARQRAGARFVPYTASLAREDSRLSALRIADSIVSALNERRVEVAFQPIVHASTGRTAFFEALLRVRLADGTVVEPGSILPVAEKAGLVRLLDQRVLELAVAKLAEDPSLHISVNASLTTILDSEWPDLLAHLLKANAGVAERLTLEITETTMIEDFDATRCLIASCKRLGVKVAMDDFGAGHTSFRNLRELAFDMVKIDGAFVQNIAHSADDRFFVRTLISLARHLDLKIVAEWVQDEETAQLLREWGVDYFQGALYGSAETAPRAPALLEASR